MATIAENLQVLNEAKIAIKNAIEEKGRDLTNVAFVDYADQILAITVAVPKPTLNAPLISVSVLYSKVVVDKSINGEFPKEYLLYINGEQKAVSTSNVIPLNDYITNENAQIQVKARNDEYFIESDFSNTIEWDIVRDGTIGLTYSGNKCTGIGTATATDIYVASSVNGVNITTIGKNAFGNATDKTIVMSDTITTWETWAMLAGTNLTVIFGENMSVFAQEAIRNMSNCVFDFRRVTAIPVTVGRPQNTGGIYIVPDNLYDEWIVATNWSSVVSQIIRATDYEAQGGAV